MTKLTQTFTDFRTKRINVVLDVDPYPSPRIKITFRGIGYYPAAYMRYKNEINKQFFKQYRDGVVEKKGIKINKMIFHMPFLKSFSKKKRLELLGQPHISRPDIDNLEKAVLDALLPDKKNPNRPFLYKDDCVIWKVDGKEKIWAENGRIEIEMEWNI